MGKNLLKGQIHWSLEIHSEGEGQNPLSGQTPTGGIQSTWGEGQNPLGKKLHWSGNSRPTDTWGGSRILLAGVLNLGAPKASYYWGSRGLLPWGNLEIWNVRDAMKGFNQPPPTTTPPRSMPDVWAIQSNLAISNSVNSKSPLFRSQADFPSFDCHLVPTWLFWNHAISNLFSRPVGLEIAGFVCISFQQTVRLVCYTHPGLMGSQASSFHLHTCWENQKHFSFRSDQCHFEILLLQISIFLYHEKI